MRLLLLTLCWIIIGDAQTNKDPWPVEETFILGTFIGSSCITRPRGVRPMWKL